MNLQKKTKPTIGTIKNYWFKNPKIGLPRTLFYCISVNFEPFDSGLEHINQPEEPLLVIEWLKLDIKTPDKLHGLCISNETHPGLEATIYIGGVHNWVKILSCTFFHVRENRFKINVILDIDFETEGISKNERLVFSTFIDYS